MTAESPAAELYELCQLAMSAARALDRSLPPPSSPRVTENWETLNLTDDAGRTVSVPAYLASTVLSVQQTVEVRTNDDRHVLVPAHLPARAADGSVACGPLLFDASSTQLYQDVFAVDVEAYEAKWDNDRSTPPPPTGRLSDSASWAVGQVSRVYKMLEEESREQQQRQQQQLWREADDRRAAENAARV